MDGTQNGRAAYFTDVNIPISENKIYRLSRALAPTFKFKRTPPLLEARMSAHCRQQMDVTLRKVNKQSQNLNLVTS